MRLRKHNLVLWLCVVSILLVVELAFEERKPIAGRIGKCVSILLVVELAFEAEVIIFTPLMAYVSILLVVELAFEVG